MIKKSAIPFFDLSEQHAQIEENILAALKTELRNTDFILGNSVSLFEQEFAHWCGIKHAIACGDGTHALELAIRSAGISAGDEVIIPAMTAIPTALAVSHTRATPVLVDVQESDALIDTNLIETAITERTRAIIPVHLYGQCADMLAVLQIARKHDLFVIEDAAQAHGAKNNNKNAGTIGDIGCFSFYPTKNLGAYGDAGMIVTNNDEAASKLRMLRNCGAEEKNKHEIIGLNSRCDSLQATILRTKLPHLEAWNAKRRKLAKLYDEALTNVPNLYRRQTNEGSVHHLYVIRVPDRAATQAALRQSGIETACHYPFAIHQHEAYTQLGFSEGSFPAAEMWAKHCLSLPLYPEMSEDVPGRVADELNTVLNG